MNGLKKLSCLFGLIFMVMGTDALAQSTPAPNEGYIDISAEESLEWHEKDQVYIARGGARAIQGTLTIEADRLIARKRAGDTGAAGHASGNFDRMTAEGNVFIRDSAQKVYGDRAVYDLDTQIVTITGSNLKYITETNIVTARDSLVYDDKKKMAWARGNALAEHAGTRLQGDVLTAHFEQDNKGAARLAKLQAEGNVVIVTKNGEVSRGSKAVYNAREDVAILSGQVRITQGETQLSGDRAAIDFASGESRLISSGSGRVRALIPTQSVK